MSNDTLDSDQRCLIRVITTIIVGIVLVVGMALTYLTYEKTQMINAGFRLEQRQTVGPLVTVWSK